MPNFSAVVFISLSLTGILISFLLRLWKTRALSNSPFVITSLYGVRAESIGKGLVVAIGGEESCEGIVEASPQNTVQDVIQALVDPTLRCVVLRPADLYDVDKTVYPEKTLEELGIADGGKLFAWPADLGGRRDDRTTESEIYRLLLESKQGPITSVELDEQLNYLNVALQQPLEYYLHLLEEDNLIVRREDLLFACRPSHYSLEVSFQQPMVVGDDNLLSIAITRMKGGMVAVPPDKQVSKSLRDIYLPNGYVTVAEPVDHQESVRLQIWPDCSSAQIRPQRRDIVLTDDWQIAADVNRRPIQFALSFQNPGRKVLELRCIQGTKSLTTIDVPLNVIERAFSIGRWTLSNNQLAIMQIIFGLISLVGVIATILSLVR